MSKQKIADRNEDVEVNCDHCGEGNPTIEHVPWECKYFEPLRKETDELLAKVPSKYLLQCIQCGIAPAMKLEEENTYWGMHVEQGEDKKIKELLGVDLSLKTPGG